jgi:hypothetical protein
VIELINGHDVFEVVDKVATYTIIEYTNGIERGRVEIVGTTELKGLIAKLNRKLKKMEVK